MNQHNASRTLTPIKAVMIGISILAMAPTIYATVERITTQDGVIPETFFGMHIHGMEVPRPGMRAPDQWPSVPFGSWRLLGGYVDWPELEPEKGQWKFSTLDQYVDLAEQHHVDVLLPLVFSPQWASSRPKEKSQYSPGNAAPPLDMNAWTTYVRTVATRYKGRIHEYEIWNEPNVPNIFSGTPDQMLELTKEASLVLKEVDPSVTVVSPSAAYNGLSWLQTFLQKGACKYVDVVGFHFYANTPEDVLPLASQVREAMTRSGCGSKPLWDTEAGWEITNDRLAVEAGGKGRYGRVLSNSEGAAYVARAYVINWASGISRFYWYAWDDGETGLIEPNTAKPKPAAVAYTEVEKWLVGAEMTACDHYDATWNCHIQRSNGYSGWIVWNTNGPYNFVVAPAWHVLNWRDLEGNDHAFRRAFHIQITQEPILLENRAQ